MNIAVRMAAITKARLILRRASQEINDRSKNEINVAVIFE